jgi:hypothetical protein
MKITTRLKPMTATEIFKLQVSGNIQRIRAAGSGFESLPAQFGGLEGQRVTMRESEVIEITEFVGDQ